jgi:ribosomal protein L11 methylase PrmA
VVNLSGFSTYRRNIDLAKAEVQSTIFKLSEKGVNVTEIEKQTQTTAENISKIDEKLEALPFTEADLIEQYEKERKLRLELSDNMDFVKERKLENEKLFKSEIALKPNTTKSIDLTDVKNNTFIPFENHSRNSLRR